MIELREKRGTGESSARTRTFELMKKILQTFTARLSSEEREICMDRSISLPTSYYRHCFDIFAMLTVRVLYPHRRRYSL
jgi:hypothetical protein